MKYLKYTVLAFSVSCIFSAMTSFAYNKGFQSIVGITLPTFGNTVDAYTHEKEILSPQYYHSSGAVDNLTSAIVNIKAQTVGDELGKSGFITVGQNETETWGESAINIFNDEVYTLQLRREKSAVTTASHSGSWYIDDRLL